MKSKLFKWIPKRYLANDPILWVFTEGYVQNEAEETIGRSLTEDELRDFVDLVWEDLEIGGSQIELVREAIEKIVAGADTWV